jgi:hypothetical protein
MPQPILIGEHALQRGLIGWIGHYAFVQLLLAFVRFRGQDVPRKGMLANHFARAGFLEPLRRTFVGLELRHKNIPGLLQERLP